MKYLASELYNIFVELVRTTPALISGYQSAATPAEQQVFLMGYIRRVVPDASRQKNSVDYLCALMIEAINEALGFPNEVATEKETFIHGAVDMTGIRITLNIYENQIEKGA